MRYFSDDRSERVNAYFPATSAIDSSHNLVLDIVFQYGFLPILFFGGFLTRNWRKLTPKARDGGILGLIFLSLNPIILVHAVTLVLFFSQKNTHE
jgi:O-antigen ligase